MSRRLLEHLKVAHESITVSGSIKARRDGSVIVTRPTSNYLRRQIGLICNDQICDRQNELFEDAAMKSANLRAGTTLACRIPRHDPLKTKKQKRHMLYPQEVPEQRGW